MNKWRVVAVLALAQFVMVLDSTVMNVSISTVVKDLNTSVTSMQAAITFYTLTMAALMLIGAKLCAKWGLLKAFAIGSVVYGIGSLITAFSQNINQLFIGWSIIEGLGAVLVIPAIAALVAVNYKGKDRVTAFAIIGGVSGAAAAAGPLIGGFMTTYLSWRYVFAIETIVMVIVLILSRRFAAGKTAKTPPIDLLSALLSAVGMTAIVFGMLQSKVWGWVQPSSVKPVINGHEIAPLGISLVAWLIVFGFMILVWFYDRQKKLEARKANPLVHVSMLSSKQLRSGLSVLLSQYMITAGVFFMVPVYLQMVLGLNALQTGIKIFPLSIALILASVAGSRLISRYSPKQIVRFGQYALVVGSVLLLTAMDVNLSSVNFALSMFIIGIGLGLLASQLGSVNMSAVDESGTSEVGGLQGSAQNLGSSLGTALVGSVLVASLTAGFLSSVNTSTLPSNTKAYIEQNVKTAQIVPASDVQSYAESKGASSEDAAQIASIYSQSQLNSLKESAFFLVILSLLVIVLSRGVPDKILK